MRYTIKSRVIKPFVAKCLALVGTLLCLLYVVCMPWNAILLFVPFSLVLPWLVYFRQARRAGQFSPRLFRKTDNKAEGVVLCIYTLLNLVLIVAWPSYWAPYIDFLPVCFFLEVVFALGYPFYLFASVAIFISRRAAKHALK